MWVYIATAIFSFLAILLLLAISLNLQSILEHLVGASSSVDSLNIRINALEESLNNLNNTVSRELIDEANDISRQLDRINGALPDRATLESIERTLEDQLERIQNQLQQLNDRE